MTHPLEGAKKEGFSGLAKGFGKGIGGLVFKPGAGNSPPTGVMTVTYNEKQSGAYLDIPLKVFGRNYRSTLEQVCRTTSLQLV